MSFVVEDSFVSPESVSVIAVCEPASALGAVDLLQEILRRVQEGHRRLVVDLGQAGTISLGMLGMLHDMSRRLQDKGGTLALAGIDNPTRERVLRCGADQAPACFDNVAKAVQALEAPADQALVVVEVHDGV